MTLSVLQLLRAAGDGAHLVARPHGVTHVYVGPLTPSGCFVPRSGRAACRAHTRRLTVLERSFAALDPSSCRRVCALCSARLAAREGAGRAELPEARDKWLTAYVDVTPFDLAVDAFMATTVDEVERVEFLALLLVGFPACHKAPVVSPAGKTSGPLMDHCRRARARVDARHDSLFGEKFEAHRAVADASRKADRKAVWLDREERIRRLGFVNATA